MHAYQTLRTDIAGTVMIVTFSNPPINLIDDAMMKDLSDLVTWLEADTEIRVVVFRSDNPDYFLAHFDIAPGPNRILPPLGAAPMHGVLHTRMSNLRQVTIGECRGRARGGGNEILVALDMCYASEKALMGQPEIMFGLHAGAGGTARLAHLVGRGRAFEAALSGWDYDAATAERFGWINRAIPDAEIVGFVDALAQRIASFPPAGIASVKSIIRQETAPGSSVLHEDSMRFWEELKFPEAQQRVAWMLENGGQTDGPLERDMANNFLRFPGKV